MEAIIEMDTLQSVIHLFSKPIATTDYADVIAGVGMQFGQFG